MQAGVMMVSQPRDLYWPESVFKALHSHCGLKKVQAFCHLACSRPYVWSDANGISQEALQDRAVFAALLQGCKAQLHNGRWLAHVMLHPVSRASARWEPHLYCFHSVLCLH